MTTPGDWLRFLAVAALYGAAFFLFRRAVPSGLESPWFALVAMICFLGLAFTARPLARIRMPGPLRALRSWETGGGVYRALRVPAFGRLLRRTPLRYFNTDVYFSDGRWGVAGVLAQVEAAEASHFWAAVLVAPYMCLAALRGAWGALFWVSFAQVVINVYPVMHLRLARHRLGRLASRPSKPAGRNA